MGTSRPNHNRRKRSRDSLDRRFDQWIETGRQFVDGVAGTRPGQRRSFNVGRRSSSSLETVGRWVGDKLDWLLEDEDGWLEPWQEEQNMSDSGNKRPLDAISRRVPQSDISALEANPVVDDEDQWPDDSSYRVDQWQRPSLKETDDSEGFSRNSRNFKSSKKRPLPRSSRKRS